MENEKNIKKKSEGFAQRLRNIRHTLQLRQSDFAERLKVSSPALSEIENGKYKPGYDFLFNLVKEFHVNLYYVLFEEGEMFRSPLEKTTPRVGQFAHAPGVQDFLETFERSPLVQYSVLAHYRNLMLRDRDIIEQDILRAEEERAASKQA
jgi:transcriptional regulator with XRE-family HTH domain